MATLSIAGRHYSGEKALYARDASRRKFGDFNVEGLFGGFRQLAFGIGARVMHPLEMPDPRGLIEGVAGKVLAGAAS